MKSKKLILLFALISIIFLFGCQNKPSNKNSAEYPYKINNIEFTKSPEHAVILSDSIADIILATSNEIKLVGKSVECTQKELKVLPEVGPGTSPNFDKILSLNPDLIITDNELSSEAIKTFSSKEIKVLTLPLAKTRPELEDLYGNIGYLFGGTSGHDKAIDVCKKILSHVDDITLLNKNNNVCITACYLYDENGSIAAGNTFAGQLINYAGAINIANDNTNNVFSIEEIKLSDPNYIFCPAELVETIKNNENYKSLSAVTQGHIYPLEKSSVLRQGKTILETVKYLNEAIYNKS